MTKRSLKDRRKRDFNCVCVCLLQGYQGMVDGGDNIKEASWESVSSMLQVVSVMRFIRPLKAHTFPMSLIEFKVT